jgi:hypothetical protein
MMNSGISNGEIMLALSLSIISVYALWTILKRDWRD